MIIVNVLTQLKDNYAYGITNNKDLIIVDPADHLSIIKYIENNNLNLKGILITHHHSDHTSGIEGILKHISVPVYSSNKNTFGTSKVIKEGDLIDLNFINMEVIGTPGHTLDHVVFYNKTNKILFSGDTLFRLGCGRVFEGSYEQMHNSLKKIEAIDDETMVYCGHEYTKANLNFLKSIFSQNKDLISESDKIYLQILRSNKSIPFNLGVEKVINPFLSSKSKLFNEFKKNKNLSDLGMFSYLRDLKNNF